MENINEQYAHLKSYVNKFIEKHAIESTINNIKMVGSIMTLLFLYFFGYFTTYVLDTLLFLFAIYVSLKTLFLATKKDDYNAIYAIKLWVTYGFCSILIKWFYALFDYPILNMFRFVGDLCVGYLFYLFTTDILNVDNISNIPLTLYQTNKSGIDSIVDLVSMVVDHSSKSVNHTYVFFYEKMKNQKLNTPELNTPELNTSELNENNHENNVELIDNNNIEDKSNDSAETEITDLNDVDEQHKSNESVESDEELEELDE